MLFIQSDFKVGAGWGGGGGGRRVFPVILYKGNNVCDCWFAFLHTRSFLEKGSTLKRKNLLPGGANYFLLEQTPKIS